jgi:hypothetical protein
MPIDEAASDAALGLQANSNVTATAAVPSAQAAQAISQEYSMGIPASGGMYAPQPSPPPEPVDIHPAVTAYQASDPARAAATRDDSQPMSFLASALGRIKNTLTYQLQPGEVSNQQSDPLGDLGHSLIHAIPDFLRPPQMGPGGLRPSTDEETRAFLLDTLNKVLMAGGAKAAERLPPIDLGKATIVGEGGPAGPTDDFVPNAPRLPAPTAELPAPTEEPIHIFDEPPAPGTDPKADEQYQAHAEENEAALDDAVAAVKKTSFSSSTPQIIHEFASQVSPDAIVTLPFEKISTLFQEDPAFVSVFHDHLAGGALDYVGDGVQMSMANYLAHLSPWHEQFKDDIAVGENLSLAEAKELRDHAAEQQQAAIEASAQPASQLDMKKAIGAIYDLPEAQWQQFYDTAKQVWGDLSVQDFKDSIAEVLSHPDDITPKEQPILDLLKEHKIAERSALTPEAKVAPAQTNMVAPAHHDYDEDIAASMGVSFGDFAHATGKEFPEPEDFADIDPEDQQEIADAKEAVAAAVNKVAKDHWLRQLFDGASALGMSPEQFRQYSIKGEAAFEAAKKKLWDTTLQRVASKYDTNWRNAYKQQYNHALNIWMAKPIIKAEHALRYSVKDQTTNIETKWVDKDGKPITFYHGSSHSNVGTPDNPWKTQGYNVISFAENPEFADNWFSGKSFDPFYVQSGWKQELAKTLYITHLKAKNPADFRNKEDVDKAYEYYAGGRSKSELANGSWGAWENPAMWKALGWDGARMVESTSQSKWETMPNACVANPEQIIFKYAVRFEEQNYKLAITNQHDYPAYYWDSLPNSFFLKEGGFDADVIADAVGYDSGMEMLDELNQFEKGRQKTPFMTYFLGLVKQEARIRTFAELYGITPADPKGLTLEDVKRYQANRVLEDAQAIFAEPIITDLLIEQLNHLLSQVGDPPITYEQIKAIADAKFSSLTMRRALNQRSFELELTRAGRKVETLLLKGKIPEALRLKQYQIIAQIQLLESHKLKGEAKSGDKRIAKWARNPIMRKQDQRTLNFIRFMLKNVGVNIRLGKFESVEQALNGETFQQFIDSLRAEGYEPIVFGLPLTETYDIKPLTHYTVDEYRGFVEMLKSLANLGKDKATGKMLGEAIQFDQIVKEIAANADGAGRKFTAGELREARERAFKELSLGSTGLGAYIARPETVAYVLDGFKLGPMTRSVIMPSMKAKHSKSDMLQDFSESIRAFMKSQPEGWGKSMKQGLDVPELVFGENANGTPTKWIRNRADLIMLMLNVGAPSNLDKLTKGFGWSTEAIFNVIWQHARPEDWKYVKFLWDQHEKLWPKIRDLGRAVQGLAPKKIEGHPVPISANGETIPGGYWPVRYDPTCVGSVLFDDGKAGVVKDPTLLDASALFGTEYHTALPNNRHTLERTKFLAPLNLNMETIYLGYMQVMHDLAYRPALIQMNKVLTHPSVRKAITDVLGKTYMDELDHWLVYQARQSVYDGKSLRTMTGWMQAFRSAFMNVQMMYNVKTAGKHALIAMAHISTEVSPKYAGAALGRLFQSPEQRAYWSNFVTENSGEVRNAMLNLDRDVREAIEKTVAKNGGVLNAYQYNGFILFTLAKQGEAMVTWLGKYMQLTDAGAPHEDAVFLADKSVRDTQGAGSISDLPPLWRGGQNFWGELGKMMNMFTSFENATGNREWVMKKRVQRLAGGGGGGRLPPPDGPENLDGWQDDGGAGAKRDLGHIVTSGLGFILIPALIAAVYDITVSKDKWEKLPEKFVENLLKGAVGGAIALGNSLEQIPKMAKTHGFSAPSTPLYEAMGTIVDTFAHPEYALDLLEGKLNKVPARWVGHAVETAGYLGGGIGVRPIKNLALATIDKARNHTGWGEFLREFTFGQSVEESKEGSQRKRGKSMRLKL